MDPRRLGCTVAALALIAAAPPPRPTPPPPIAPPGETVDMIQGVAVADPYRWLEEPNDPQVKAWVAGQNATSGAYFASLPSRDPLHNWLLSMEKATPVYDGGLRVAGGRMFVYTIEPGRQQPLLGLVRFVAGALQRQTILNPNTLSAKGDTAIDFFEPSPDGKLVAVSLSQGGSEDGTLHVYDVDTRREVEPPIPHVRRPGAGGSLAWTADAKGYWYTRFPDDGPASEREFHQTAWFHLIGRPTARDAMVLGPGDGLPRTAEVFLSNRLAGPEALASVQLGDGGEWQHYLVSRTGARRVAGYDDKIVAAAQLPGGGVVGISRKAAPNGAIARLDAGGGPGAWRTIVPEAAYALTSDTPVVSGGRIYALAIDGGPTRLLAYTDAGKPVAVRTPPVANVNALEADGAGGLFYRVRSYTMPPVTMHLAAGATAAMPTPIRLTSPLSFADIEVRRVFATSTDGTRVPITVMARKGTAPDGARPTLLYGYGGYGINLSPHFLSADDRAWFDAGGVYAITNIRGGGEYGERWHQQGMLTHKQAVFDDFYAAGRWLIDNRWTSSAHLALEGGSNGGLLMGATVTQHPDLARAVVSEVGIYDMVRVENDVNGTFNVSEFGTVKDAAQFRALYAYSPYHHVAAGAPYPAMLLTTGDNDGRVNPFHSRKFAAAMQAATGSGRPVYLRTTADAGHGIGSSLEVAISEEADVTAFLFDQLGMNWSPPAK